MVRPSAKKERRKIIITTALSHAHRSRHSHTISFALRFHSHLLIASLFRYRRIIAALCALTLNSIAGQYIPGCMASFTIDKAQHIYSRTEQFTIRALRLLMYT